MQSLRLPAVVPGRQMNLLFADTRLKGLDALERNKIISTLAQIGLGVEAVELGCLDEGVDRRGPLAAGIGACKHVVLASQGHRPFILPMSGRS